MPTQFDYCANLAEIELFFEVSAVLFSRIGAHGFGRWGEGGEWDALDGGFVFFDGGGAAEDGGEEGFSFFGFFLVPHAEVTAGVFEVHHVFVCGVHRHLWISVAERLRGFAFRMDFDRSAS